MKVLSREVSNFTANTEVWTVRPESIDQIFRLIVTAPKYTQPGTKICGLIGLDGDVCAGAVVSAVNAMAMVGPLPPTVAVSIGYPFGKAHDWLLLRVRDLTPVRFLASEEFNRLSWNAPCPPSGGADAFLSFIDDEVKPVISELYAIDPAEWTLTGASLAGLFTLHALFARPGSFRRYNAVSPSLWWKRPYMFEEAQSFAGMPGVVDAAIHLSVGDRETPEHFKAYSEKLPENLRASWQAFGELDMIGDAKKVASTIRSRAGLKVQTEIMVNETHQTVYGVALSHGLRWLHEVTRREGMAV